MYLTPVPIMRIGYLQRWEHNIILPVFYMIDRKVISNKTVKKCKLFSRKKKIVKYLREKVFDPLAYHCLKNWVG